MPSVEGTIEAVAVKDRETKWGTKKATSFKMGDNWYSGGFKKWDIEKGDVVSLTYTTNDKGYHDVKGIAVTEKAPEAPVSKAQSGVPRGGRSFPMDALDPGRVIVRQNSLGHAVKYCRDNMGSTYSVSDVIDVARELEAYSCGDLDVEEAKAMLEASEEND